MQAMQYEITLPADYDMAVISRRVAEKGPLLDHLPGLGLKAYLIRECGVDDSPINQYAPFYLWSASAGIGDFLWGGGGFAGVAASFGRPAVRHWAGAACLSGPAAGAVPMAATRRLVPVEAEGDPAPALARAKEALRARAADPAVHTAALAVDLARWETVEFTLWSGPAPEAAGTRYQVLHLSRPGVERIAGFGMSG